MKKDASSEAQDKESPKKQRTTHNIGKPKVAVVYDGVVYRNLKRVFASMGVPNLRFHDLRHSYAVLSLQSGCDIKTVQETLGHYAAAFTLDTYGHVTAQMRREGADKMNQFLKQLNSNSSEDQ